MFGDSIYQFLTTVLMPTPLALGLICIGLLLRRLKPILAGICILASLSTLITLSLPVTANKLISSLENQHPPRVLSELPSADIIVLLAGGVDTARPPRQHSELGARGDRVLTVLRLLQATKAERIIVAGSNQSDQNGVPSEAQATRDLLIELGIGPGRILEAVSGKNTRETARFAASRLQALEVNRMILVTSAYHMPRSVQLFEELAPEVIPVTANHLIINSTFKSSMLDWIPSAVSLSGSTLAINEYLGMLVNRWLP